MQKKDIIKLGKEFMKPYLTEQEYSEVSKKLKKIFSKQNFGYGLNENMPDQQFIQMIEKRPEHFLMYGFWWKSTGEDEYWDDMYSLIQKRRVSNEQETNI
jgi:hypothetical protein